jgi:hypothetical protein
MRKFVFGGSFASAVPLLLDLYPAIAAYSVRKLRTGVTNVIRVRRTGDNAERDFSEIELNDGTITSWVIAGGGAQNGRIVTWYDQSGNNIHKTQPTGTHQPFIVQGGVLFVENGKPTIVRTLPSLNSVTWMYGSHTFPTGDILTTNVFVGKRISGTSTTAGHTTIIPFVPDLTNNRRYVVNAIESTTSFAVRLQGGNTIFNSGSGYVQSLFSTWRDTANTDFKARRNGTTLTVASSGASKNLNIQSNSAFCIFNGSIDSYINAPSANVDGSIQESIWWLSDESANLPSIETNINTYYGIY